MSNVKGVNKPHTKPRLPVQFTCILIIFFLTSSWTLGSRGLNLQEIKRVLSNRMTQYTWFSYQNNIWQANHRQDLKKKPNKYCSDTHKRTASISMTKPCFHFKYIVHVLNEDTARSLKCWILSGYTSLILCMIDKKLCERFQMKYSTSKIQRKYKYFIFCTKVNGTLFPLPEYMWVIWFNWFLHLFFTEGDCF